MGYQDLIGSPSASVKLPQTIMMKSINVQIPSPPFVYFYKVCCDISLLVRYTNKTVWAKTQSVKNDRFYIDAYMQLVDSLTAI